eukprot:COSAG02_NODE_8114_length_2704_cov_1.761228_2_plen_148_part_00
MKLMFSAHRSAPEWPLPKREGLRVVPSSKPCTLDLVYNCSAIGYSRSMPTSSAGPGMLMRIDSAAHLRSQQHQQAQQPEEGARGWDRGGEGLDTVQRYTILHTYCILHSETRVCSRYAVWCSMAVANVGHAEEDKILQRCTEFATAR